MSGHQAAHVLVVEGDADYGFTCRIECPTQPPTATMPCATYGEQCRCNDRLAAVKDDDDAWEALNERLFDEACPSSPTGQHAWWDGDWWQPVDECWPAMMIEAATDQVRDLGITSPGRYAVTYRVEDDGEWMSLSAVETAEVPS